MIEDLVTALAAEFAGEVQFHASIPANIQAPSVIVAPSDPFIQPDTHGQVRESWDVLVAVSVKDSASGISQLRDLSLRVRKIVVALGAVWRMAEGPRKTSQENAQQVISVNQIDFKYPPPM